MTSPEERIEHLVRAKSIDAAEGERLLAALHPSSERGRGNSYDPFARWGGERTSLAGLVVAAFGVATSRLGARYDGVIDLHFGRSIAPVPLTTALVDQLLAVVVTAALLWAAARIASRARFVDVLGAVALARAPLVLIALPVARIVRLLPADVTKASSTPLLIALALPAVAGLIAQLFLLVLGMRAASGASGMRLFMVLLAGLVAAEMAIKFFLFLLSR